MNRLLSSLSAICAEHPLDKKYLVVPSYQIGRQLGDALAADGSSWVNLHSVTLPALAEQAAGPELAASGTRVISGAEALSLVDQVFGQLKDAGRLDYFGRVEATAGTIGAIQGSIFSLRMAGLKSAALDPASFIDDRKGRELALLLRSYEEELEKGRLIDLPGVYEIALKSVAARPEAGPAPRRPPKRRSCSSSFGSGPSARSNAAFSSRSPATDWPSCRRTPSSGCSGRGACGTRKRSQRPTLPRTQAPPFSRGCSTPGGPHARRPSRPPGRRPSPRRSTSFRRSDRPTNAGRSFAACSTAKSLSTKWR